jgi:2-polyprenyl-3-methyl-5-hydroxy-6-metoxy-1,4-benzoquinol methylase
VWLNIDLFMNSLMHENNMNEFMKSNREHDKRYCFVKVYACNMCGTLTEENAVIGIRLNCSQGFRPTLKSGIAVSVIRCRCCNLIYSSPLPIPFNVQDHYGVPPDEYWTEQYFVNDSNYFAEQISKAKKLINFKAGMKALDIGAGLGKGMVALAKAGFDAEGFEPSATFYEKAIERMGVSSEKLKLGMIEEIDFTSESFDFITFGAVLEHLYDPNDAISKAVKWIKPNGVIHIEVPSADWLISKIVNIFYKITRANFVTNISPMHEPYHLYEYTLQSFIENGKLNNYEVASFDYSVCTPVHIPKIFHRIFIWYMNKTNTGMQLTVYLRRS